MMIKKSLQITALIALVFGFSCGATAAEENPSSIGRQLFNSYCFLCHGPDGTGGGHLAKKLGIVDKVKDLTGDTYGTMDTKELAKRIAGYTRGVSMMPKWKDSLDDEEIMQVATYTKSLGQRKSYVDGKNIYFNTCAVCHGSDGKGGGAIAKQLELDARIPDLTTPKYVKMSRPDLVKTITDYSAKEQNVPNWGRQLDARSLQDVAAYIQLNPTGIQAIGNKVNGKTIYLRNCIACHGKEGKGDGILAGLLGVEMVDYTTKDSSSISDAQLIHLISMGRGEFMPAWFGELSAYDIRDVAAYVSTLYKKE